METDYRNNDYRNRPVTNDHRDKMRTDDSLMKTSSEL